MPGNRLKALRIIAQVNRDELAPDSARKFAFVERQIRRVTLGRTESIGCPYCFSSIVVGVDRLCCTSMGETVATILQSTEADCVHGTDGVGVFASRLKSLAEADKTEGSSRGNTSTQSIQ
jgi:hypothetical protein